MTHQTAEVKRLAEEFASERAISGLVDGHGPGTVGLAREALFDAIDRLASKPDAAPAGKDAAQAAGRENIWTVKIGGRMDGLPSGADAPMRRAVQDAYARVTGFEPEFTFSGWGGSLDEGERAVHENRPPREAVYPSDGTYPEPTPAMLNGDRLFDAIWNAIKGWDISRHSDGLYAGSSGNDARHIYDAIVASSAAPAGGAVEALRELVAVKDLKARFTETAHAWLRTGVNGWDLVQEEIAEYERRKPDAWAAARAALAAAPVVPPQPDSQGASPAGIGLCGLRPRRT